MRYVRASELLTERAIARGNGTYPRVIQQYKKPMLFFLDEWLLYPLKETEARDIFEIAEARYKKAFTIFCSQFDVLGWREKIGDPILADALCTVSIPILQHVIDCKESMGNRKASKTTKCKESSPHQDLPSIRVLTFNDFPRRLVLCFLA